MFTFCGPEKESCVAKQTLKDKSCLVPCTGLYADIEENSFKQTMQANMMAGRLLMYCAFSCTQGSSKGDLVTHSLTHSLSDWLSDFLISTLKSNPGDLWPLRHLIRVMRKPKRQFGDLWHLKHWLQLLQLRNWIRDNNCYLAIKSDSGQHSQFLRCFACNLLDLKQRYE